MKSNQDNCILFFVKYPEKGQVKQRLSPDLSEEITQELYICFVHDILIMLKKIDAQLLICFTPENAQEKFQRWLGSALRFLPQRGEDLGERMKNSFIDAFAQGFHRAVLMGSDSPDLPESFLHTAFSELRTHDVVLGPSSDGGYYLIGFRSTTFHPEVFEGIEWSSQTVLQETLKKIRHFSHRLSLLPVWSDVDTLTDLQNLMKRNRDTGFKSSQTMTYIRQHVILSEDDHGISKKR
jgi:rSAM/selenodomain-associated transferase 1